MMMRVTAAISLVCVGILTACGGSSSSRAPQPGSGALSGNWQVALTRTSGQSPVVSHEAGFLLQTGKQVGGSLTFQNNKGTCVGTGAVSGTADGSGVALTVNQPGLTVNLTGDTGIASLDPSGATVCTPGGGSAGGNSCLTGGYILLASGCGSSESGTWNGFQVQPLNMALSGTLTSNSTGATSTASVTLKQAANTGGASAAVTGTLTPAAGASACIPSGPLAGQISGNAVILAIISGPDKTIGTIKGQIQGLWLPLGNAALPEPQLAFPGKGTAYNFSIYKGCNLQSGNDPNCIDPDLNNPMCVTDPTCTPDPLDPSKCPGPKNPQCTGIKVVGCESGTGTLCQSGAC
jgi:hypothetical protein